MTTGGGGYGEPIERNPEMVLHDVNEDYVSMNRAEEVYKVVFDELGNIDVPATEELRSTSAP